ncbi:hypothetical protein FJT64_008070 [Amphibalanus amphitrite]|uniref:Uncharacterized protein n=1 Tax=Amphibalanus amphitrite TaxID=1232801 RepID=A0A6A4VJP9_AMPAM|nr:hypothetical protein FJT64_008070 [Amphibalanus amphitrite]
MRRIHWLSVPATLELALCLPTRAPGLDCVARPTEVTPPGEVTLPTEVKVTVAMYEIPTPEVPAFDPAVLSQMAPFYQMMPNMLQYQNYEYRTSDLATEAGTSIGILILILSHYP